MIYKKNHLNVPKDVVNMFDLGFLGVEDFPQQLSSLYTIQKGKGLRTFSSGKEYNRNHSIKRIVIEHAICRLKKFKIMEDVFRNRLKRYDRISDMMAGLVNYRTMNPA